MKKEVTGQVHGYDPKTGYIMFSPDVAGFQILDQLPMRWEDARIIFDKKPEKEEKKNE